MTTTDEDLLEAYYAGNDAAVGWMFRKCDWLSRYASGWLRAYGLAGSQTADDIAQKAWVKVMDTRTKGARWSRADGAVRPWLAKIALNVVRDEYRVAQRRAASAGEPLDAADLRQSEVFEQCDLEDVVGQCLAWVTDFERDVVILKFWVGQSQKEIAQTLDVSEATISRTWKAARAKLERLLKETLPYDDL